MLHSAASHSSRFYFSSQFPSHPRLQKWQQMMQSTMSLLASLLEAFDSRPHPPLPEGQGKAEAQAWQVGGGKHSARGQAGPSGWTPDCRLGCPTRELTPCPVLFSGRRRLWLFHLDLGWLAPFKSVSLPRRRMRGMGKEECRWIARPCACAQLAVTKSFS